MDWYLNTLSEVEGGSLAGFAAACGMHRRDWREELPRDIRRGTADIAPPSTLEVLTELQDRMGAKLYSEVPIFEEGDGAHIVMETRIFPATLRRVSPKKVEVTFDRVKMRRHTDQTLYVPLVEYGDKDIRTFTKRKDGSYRIRGGKWLLKLGRQHLIP